MMVMMSMDVRRLDICLHLDMLCLSVEGKKNKCDGG